MPKNLEVEHDAMDREPIDPSSEAAPSGAAVSAKERGRWKRKQVVLERMSKQAQGQTANNGDAEIEESTTESKKVKTIEWNVELFR